MKRSSLWRIGASLTVICFLFGCATAIEHEPVSTYVPDATWMLEPTLPDATWMPEPTLPDATWAPEPTLLDLPGRIAFTSYRDGDANIYVMNTDGTDQHRLTDDPWWDWAPAWSPDGRSIAFYSVRDGSQDVYVMNADGSNQRNLSQIPDMGPSLDNIQGPPSWSPDGRRIVFGFGYRGDMGYRIYEIYVVDADGSNLHNLGYGLSPVWSSDGDSILFVCGGYPTWAICEMDAGGSNQRYLTSVTLDGLWSSGLAVSPDGRSIVLGYHEPSRHSGVGIYIIDVDGSSRRHLIGSPALDADVTRTPDDGIDSDGMDDDEPDLPRTCDRDPTWSPDGRYITFSSCRDGNWEIYVMNADGTDQRNLTQHPAIDTDPAWSP